jgi:hypothetical protein
MFRYETKTQQFRKSMYFVRLTRHIQGIVMLCFQGYIRFTHVHAFSEHCRLW